MDAYLARERSARGKAGASAAQFSDLKISRSVDTSLYTGLDVFIDTLLGDGEFKTNRAAYVGVSPPAEGATGHAIGIFRQGTGKYHLFDPNIGTYELDSAGVREAFIYIFRKAYPNMGSGDTSDNHAYEVGGKIRGGYTIFESTLKSTPSVTPLPKPTATLPKPQVLSVMTTPPKFQPVVSGKPAPLVEKQPLSKAATAGAAQTGGGKVADLINRFNR
jgi:hypothetical protein